MKNLTSTGSEKHSQAFPILVPDERGPNGEGICEGFFDTGMTKRDFFAAHALHGLLAHHGRYWQSDGANQNFSGLDAADAASLSRQFADALLIELSKPSSAV